MESNNITVIYKWQAKPGKLNELKDIYAQVCSDMEHNEPGALIMQYYADDNTNELVTVIISPFYSQCKGFYLGTIAEIHLRNILLTSGYQKKLE